MSGLEITGIDVYLCEDRDSVFADSTRTSDFVGFLVVVIKTNSDIEGIGFTYHDMCGLAIGTMIKDTIEPLLIGRDPLCNEDIWQYLYNYMYYYGRKGTALYALSALDVALWDIKGKVAGLPLYKLLGGSQTKIPAYASGGWTSYTKDELVKEATNMVASGFKSIKIKVGVEGGTNINEDVRRVAAVRKAIGDDIDLFVDANFVWKASDAILFAKKAEQYDLGWFEEPVIADDIEGLARVRNNTTIPIAAGENEYTRYGARDLVVGKAIDIYQPDPCYNGGITEVLKMNAIAQAWNLKLALHCVDFVTRHMASAATNSLIVEHLLVWDGVINKMFLNPPVIKNGMIEITDLPGLGLKLDMDYVSRIKVG